MKKFTEHLNWTLIIVVVALLVIGVVNLYSALKVWGEVGYMRLFWSQVLWIGVGAVVLAAFALFDYRLLDKFAYPIYFISLVLLVLVLFVGKEVYGHKSWLGFDGFGIQPSEFAKVALILALGKYFSDNPHPDGYGVIDLIKPALLAAVPAGLVVAQHDMGGALYFVAFFISFSWFAKVKKATILLIAVILFSGALFGYYFVLHDYQKARFTTFLNPSYDVKGSGYHLMQSRIAVGSGMIFGKGYLKGNINKLRYLPEKHTDFIFPVLAEEWGFLGCFVTLTCYYLLFTMIITIAKQTKERLGIFIAIGIGIYLFVQTAVNLGGVLGIMPLTGVTLPFLSYGGSSIISVMAAVGVLISISRKRFLF